MTIFAMHIRPGGKKNPHWRQGITEALENNIVFFGWGEIPNPPKLNESSIKSHIEKYISNTSDANNASALFINFFIEMKIGDYIFCSSSTDNDWFLCQVIGEPDFFNPRCLGGFTADAFHG